MLGYDPTNRHAAFTQALYDWLYGVQTCKTCKGPTAFEGMMRGYRSFCSRKCSAADSDLKHLRTIRTDEQKKSRRTKIRETIEKRTQEEDELIRQRRIQAHANRTSESEQVRRSKISEFWNTLSDNDAEMISHRRLDGRRESLVEIAKNVARNRNVSPRFDWQEYAGRTNIYPWQCNTCSTEFEDWLVHVHPEQTPRPRCPTCYPLTHGISKEEKSLTEWIRSIYPGRIVENDRRTIGKEIDILIPNLRIGIEYNGAYWHSEKIVGKDSALNKLSLANDAGLSLITIMDFEWLRRENAVKNRLTHLLGLSEKIPARACKVVPVSPEKCRDFLENTHTQGDVQSEVRLGLEYAGKLVAVMTFGTPRFSKTIGWELLRYAAINNVQGGASKLFDHFVAEYNPWRVISFADRRWSFSGGLYKKLGFIPTEATAPGYFWCKSREIKTRLQCQKHKLVKQGHDPNKTEYEIMTGLGWQRVWDCGHHRFVWDAKIG